MLDVKQIVYNALSSLSIKITDNPDGNGHKHCPYAILRTITTAPINIRTLLKLLGY